MDPVAVVLGALFGMTLVLTVVLFSRIHSLTFELEKLRTDLGQHLDFTVTRFAEIEAAAEKQASSIQDCRDSLGI